MDPDLYLLMMNIEDAQSSRNPRMGAFLCLQNWALLGSFYTHGLVLHQPNVFEKQNPEQ